MAEPALQYDEFEDIEPIEIPAGGIATFLTAKEGMFADDDNIPQGGIAQVKAVADQLAEFGRHEDEYMVHAAHGETVIPMEVFRKNPILKENIYKQMRDMGLEPERYVVGSEFNSINPVTGQPEFFLKKLFKGIKKVFKVVAPVLLTAGLNVIAPGLGTIVSGAISGGIMGLASGKGLQGALKGAALGGITAGAFKAASGAIGAAKEGGNLLTGAKAGFLAEPGQKAFEEGAKSALVKEAQQQAIKESLTEEAIKSGMTTDPFGTDIAKQTDLSGVATIVEKPTQAPGFGQAFKKLIPGVQEGEVGRGFRPLEGLQDIFLPGRSVSQQAKNYLDTLPADQLAKELGSKTKDEVIKQFTKDALGTGVGSFVRRFGPGIGAVLAVDALNRQEPEDFNVDEQITGFDLYRQDPFRYSVGTIQPRPTNFKIKTLTQEDFGLPSTGSVYLPYAAEGGEIDENMFPRMNGPIEGPGTETSDDIPAMLSDGEFVMTAKAVRGAGNGSRQEGMKNMYQMMSNFEARA